MPESLPLLKVSGLLVYRGNKLVVDVPSLELHRGEVLAVAGPNGAGKSTFLQSVTGLIKSSSGEIYVNDLSTKSDLLKLRRNCALVLQEPLLIHTSVRENVAIGLNFRGSSAENTARNVDHWLEVFGITHLSRRNAYKLSGGEAQRVSLARAFATGADLLLLDEPFSALDAPTRSALLNDFQSILKSSKQTAIFITHDLDEALMLGDKLAILIGGKLRQVGTPRQVFNEPADSEVADFVGVETIIPGVVSRQIEGLAEVKVGETILEAVSDQPVGKLVYLCLRPEDITIARNGERKQSSARNHLTCHITRIQPRGPLARVWLESESIPLVSLITRNSAMEMGLTSGIEVTANFKASAVHLLPR